MGISLLDPVGEMGQAIHAGDLTYTAAPNGAFGAATLAFVRCRQEPE